MGGGGGGAVMRAGGRRVMLLARCTCPPSLLLDLLPTYVKTQLAYPDRTTKEQICDPAPIDPSPPGDNNGVDFSNTIEGYMEMGRALALGIFEYYGLSLPPPPLQSTHCLPGSGSGFGAGSPCGTPQQRRAGGSAGVISPQLAVRGGGSNTTSFTRGALSEAPSGPTRAASATAALVPSMAPLRAPLQAGGGSLNGSSGGGGRGGRGGGGRSAPQQQQQQLPLRRYTSSPLDVRTGSGGGRGEGGASGAARGAGTLVVNGSKAASAAAAVVKSVSAGSSGSGMGRQAAAGRDR